MCVCTFGCIDDLVKSSFRAAVTDVFQDRSRKQIHILLDDTDLLS